MTKSKDGKVITFNQGWAVMQKGFTKLSNQLEGKPGQEMSREERNSLYHTAFTLCTQDPPNYFPQQLYDKYKEFLEDNINSKVLPAFRDKHDELMLKELLTRWDNHKVMVGRCSQYLNYLDRYYIPRIQLPTLGETGVMCFRDLVYAMMKVDVKDVVIAMINRERVGEHIDRALLKNVVGVFVKIAMGQMEAYEADFETFMLEDTGAFYRRIASSCVKELSCPEYMTRTEEWLKQEKERVGHYLYPSTEPKLLETVQQELLSQYQVQLLEKEHSGCHRLLRDGEVDDLSRMYRLYSPIPKGLEPVAAIFRQHVTDEGTALVKQVTDNAASNKKAEKKDIVGVQEQGFIQKVMGLHDKYLGYVTQCFGDHFVFHKALKEAFVVFCNKGVEGSTSAELLASFCDSLLKKGGSRMLSDEAMEDTLEKVVKLLAYIDDKDLFGEFCRKKLARRLLFDNSASEDHEQSILMKLKHLCGAQFTLKMDGMVTDIQVASENQSNFEQYLAANENTNLSVNLSVTVLNTIKWPTYKTSDLTLPVEMVKCIKVYQEYYKTKRNEPRKLTWMYSLGSCNVIGKFDVKSIELIVTTYQGAILMLFNGGDRLSYNDIKNQVNLTDEDIVRLLHSLSCAKYKILTKDPNTKMVGENDSFEFNTKFTDKMRRIKIPMPLVDEKSKKAQEVVDEDRRYTIDATIVHIMKRRKQLLLQELIVECVKQLIRIFKEHIDVVFVGGSVGPLRPTKEPLIFLRATWRDSLSALITRDGLPNDAGVTSPGLAAPVSVQLQAPLAGRPHVAVTATIVKNMGSGDVRKITLESIVLCTYSLEMAAFQARSAKSI